MNFLENIRYYASRLLEPLDNLPGRVTAFLLLVINFFAPIWYPFLVVLVLIVFDLYWGIRASLRQGNFCRSEIGRRTVDKITSYASCLVAAYLIERILFNDSIVMTAIVSALAIACELWSFSASILIIHPEFPFIRLFRKYLKDEIENKIGMTLNELEIQAAKADKENISDPKQETECFGSHTDVH